MGQKGFNVSFSWSEKIRLPLVTYLCISWINSICLLWYRHYPVLNSLTKKCGKQIKCFQFACFQVKFNPWSWSYFVSTSTLGTHQALLWNTDRLHLQCVVQDLIRCRWIKRWNACNTKNYSSVNEQYSCRAFSWLLCKAPSVLTNLIHTLRAQQPGAVLGVGCFSQGHFDLEPQPSDWRTADFFRGCTANTANSTFHKNIVEHFISYF